MRLASKIAIVVVCLVGCRMQSINGQPKQPIMQPDAGKDNGAWEDKDFFENDAVE
jgi:hypothetical protein